MSAHGEDFRRVGADVVHVGYAIEVAVETFAGPDGERFTRDVVHHPGAVAVVPLHADGTVTLVRQFRAPVRREMLEIPAGIRDEPGEPTEETARRELAEEVGLAAGELSWLVSFHNAVGFSDELVEIHLATGLSPVPAAAQGPEEEAMKIERLPLTKLLEMIASGELTDGKTVLGLLLARDRVR